MENVLIEIPGELPIIRLLRALARERLTLKHDDKTGLLRLQELPARIDADAGYSAMHAGD